MTQSDFTQNRGSTVSISEVIISMTACLFVSKIMEKLLVGSFWKKKSEDGSWSNLDPSKFWESSESSSGYKKKTYNLDFPIYLLLRALGRGMHSPSAPDMK